MSAAAWGAGWLHLQWLALDGNVDLNGTLPNSWANWVELEHFSANWTQLQGTFPSAWANMPELRSIQILGAFHGELPDVWS